MNESVVAVLRRAHLERATRWLHRRVQPWEARRNYIDDARLEQVLPIILTPESNCVDVGAHAGSFLTILTEVAPKGRHIAFEPVAEFRRRLAHDHPNVAINGCALSDSDGDTEFLMRPDKPARSGFRAPNDCHAVRRVVRTRRLDSVLEDGYQPDLIKIDVEGAEMSVLEGAKTTLTRWRPFIAFEHGIAAREWYGVESVDLFESLSSLGYIIIDMDFMRHTRATFQETRLWNFLALPDARLRRTFA